MNIVENSIISELQDFNLLGHDPKPPSGGRSFPKSLTRTLLLGTGACVCFRAEGLIEVSAVEMNF